MLRIATIVLGLSALVFAGLIFLEDRLLPQLADARDWYLSLPQPGAKKTPQLSQLLGPAAQAPQPGAKSQPPAKGEPLEPQPQLLIFGIEGLKSPEEDALGPAFRLRMQRAKAPAYRPVLVPAPLPLRQIRASLQELAEAGPRPRLRILLVLGLEELAALCALPQGAAQAIPAQAIPAQAGAAQAGPPAKWPQLAALPRLRGWARLPILSLQRQQEQLLARSARDQLPRLLWPLFRKSPEPEQELRRWCRYQVELDGIASAIQRLQARLLLAWRPHPIEWNSQALSKLLETHQAVPSSFESARARRRLQDLCSTRGFAYLDLGTALIRAPRGLGPCFKMQEHSAWRWQATQLGRNVMFEALCPALARLLRAK